MFGYYHFLDPNLVPVAVSKTLAEFWKWWGLGFHFRCFQNSFLWSLGPVDLWSSLTFIDLYCLFHSLVDTFTTIRNNVFGLHKMFCWQRADIHTYYLAGFVFYFMGLRLFRAHDSEGESEKQSNPGGLNCPRLPLSPEITYRGYADWHLTLMQ